MSNVANHSLWSIAGRLLPATLAVQVLSFVSSIAFARTLGATDGTDAYFLALSIPVIVYAILLAGTRLGAIPSLTELSRERPDELSQAASEIVSAVTVAAVVLSLATQLIALVVIPAVVGGSAHLHHLARLMIVELIPYGVTGALAGVLGALLAIRGKFVLAVLATGIEPIVKTALVLSVGHSIGAQSQVIGNLAGSSLAALLLWWCVEREGIRVRPTGALRTGVVADVLKISLPLVIAQTVLQVNPFIDRATASGLSRGSVTVLELGLRLFSAPLLLLSAGLITPLTATWSARLGAGGLEPVRASLLRAVKVIALTLPPLVVLGVVLRYQIVGVVYSGGAYSHASVLGTAGVMGMLLLGFPAQILVMLLATLFVIHRDTVFPMKVALANVVLNLGLDIALRGPLGTAGIALSTSITLALLCGAYVWGATRRWGSIGLAALRRPLAATLLSAAVMSAATIVLTRAIGSPAARLGQLAMIFEVGVVAVAIHVIILWISREPLSSVLPPGLRLPTLGGVTGRG